MKKLIRDLGLPVEKIDTCKNSCMLYWNDNIDLDYCKFYGEASYLSLTTRLQRLYASEATVEQLTWHANHQTEEGSMYHPSDAEAWRHFDWTYLNFAVEFRNVRLGLCTDEFALHRKYSRMHSYWPVILTPYNLPLRMSMSSEYMFLTMELRMHGMKSHDCHVFMQKLILTVFCEMLPEHVWSALTEVSLLLQILRSKMLDVNKISSVIDDSSQVVMDNHSYDLHIPNGIQLVVVLSVANQQGAGTSRSTNGESDDESDEDSFDEDYETKENNNYD
ncbi:UNVERIFIED_CONTAM: hypothetical protein Scaly_3133400 [Sesamum calycinum]|uniref:Uncharacterized protein n=1 Tax=Sesamum calycinum TaxID=2727403 RepID=A0AAW2JI35_9LAMI